MLEREGSIEWRGQKGRVIRCFEEYIYHTVFGIIRTNTDIRSEIGGGLNCVVICIDRLLFIVDKCHKLITL